jgi:hypothetical protein
LVSIGQGGGGHDGAEALITKDGSAAEVHDGADAAGVDEQVGGVCVEVR